MNMSAKYKIDQLLTKREESNMNTDKKTTKQKLYEYASKHGKILTEGEASRLERFLNQQKKIIENIRNNNI